MSLIKQALLIQVYINVGFVECVTSEEGHITFCFKETPHVPKQSHATIPCADKQISCGGKQSQCIENEVIITPCWKQGLCLRINLLPMAFKVRALHITWFSFICFYSNEFISICNESEMSFLCCRILPSMMTLLRLRQQLLTNYIACICRQRETNGLSLSLEVVQPCTDNSSISKGMAVVTLYNTR